MSQGWGISFFFFFISTVDINHILANPTITTLGFCWCNVVFVSRAIVSAVVAPPVLLLPIVSTPMLRCACKILVLFVFVFLYEREEWYSVILTQGLLCLVFLACLVSFLYLIYDRDLPYETSSWIDRERRTNITNLKKDEHFQSKEGRIFPV